MSDKLSNLNEVMLAKKLATGLTSLDDIACPLDFEDLHLPKTKRKIFEPLALVASLLFAMILTLGFIVNKENVSNNYQVKNLSPLIKQSQLLENKITVLNAKNSKARLNIAVITAFYEIEKIDEQLEKIYSSGTDYKSKTITAFWQKRIDKLNFVLQFIDPELNPLYI